MQNSLFVPSQESERLYIYILISHYPTWHRDTKYKIYYLHNICTCW